MPLREELKGIGQRVVQFLDSGGDPPFVLYQYRPEEEWQVRQNLGELRRWLEAEPRRVTCAAISLARLFWAALDESGYFKELVSREIEAAGDSKELAEVHAAVGEILRQRPTLAERTIAEISSYEGRVAVFLYRAGALYPAYRVSTLLDDLRDGVRLPVTLLYPGHLVGEYGLSFMGRSEPAYGYRALIVPRGTNS